MIDRVGEEINMVCRQARKRFDALERRGGRTLNLSATECAAIQRHLQTCARCEVEYRIFALRRAALDLAGAAEPVTPDEDFFRGLRARIARGPETSRLRPADESWTAAMLLTARQLLPVMAALLLLMVGVTFLWERPSGESQAALRPRERVMFSDMYDYPEPTRDDVLETLVAVEEKENGKQDQ
jgi:hypothetical protein